jgi:hypothetical protein
MPALAQAATTSLVLVGPIGHIAQVTDRGTAVVDASILARELVSRPPSKSRQAPRGGAVRA